MREGRPWPPSGRDTAETGAAHQRVARGRLGLGLGLGFRLGLGLELGLGLRLGLGLGLG